MYPILQSQREVGLLEAHIGISVEIVGNSHNVKLFVNRNCGGAIDTEAANVAILATKSLTTNRSAAVAPVINGLCT